MNAPSERTWKTVESGPHTLEGALHPVVVKNYGKWKYHKMIKPGVMVHYGHSGDALYTVGPEHRVRTRLILSGKFVTWRTSMLTVLCVSLSATV